MSHRFRRSATLFLALTAPATVHADLPTINDEGGINLVISFDYPSLIESGYLDVDGFTEARYCSMVEKISHHLWQTTERQHFLRRVEFRLGTTEADLNWSFVPESTTSYGSFRDSVLFRERWDDSRSPVNNPPTSPMFDPMALEAFDDDLAWKAVHELGHFIYDARDEYVHGRDSGGTLGICSSFAVGFCSLSGGDCVDSDDCPGGENCVNPTKQGCDEDADCRLFETCIFKDRRTGEFGEASKICSDHSEESDPEGFTTCEDDGDCADLEDAVLGGPAKCIKTDLFLCSGLDNVTTHCWTDEDCQQDGNAGLCVREGESGQPPLTPVCRDPEEPYPGEPNVTDWRNRTSSMASSSGGGRWCNSESHRHHRAIQRGEDGGFSEEGVEGFDPDFELTRPEDYNTWAYVVRTHPSAADKPLYHDDLLKYFDEGQVYPPWADLERSDFDNAVELASPFCRWNIDEIPVPGDNTMVVVDKSGSMDYVIGFGSAEKSAFEWAAEGALVVMEQTEMSNYTGILAFDDGTTPIRPYIERSMIDFEDDPFEQFFDGVGPGGDTDIGNAIQAAAMDMAGEGPASDRNIILMSDGANTVQNGPSPVDAAFEACQMGIAVNTIAFGDADLEELEEIAHVCDGLFRMAGTENAMVQGEDAHLLKTEFVTLSYELGDFDTIFEDVLGTLSDDQDVVSRQFEVPVDAGPLTFLWIGNEVPYCAEFADEACIDVRDVWSELVFSLEGPSQQMVPGQLGNSFQAFSHVADPEPGVWTARVDAAAVPVVENFIIREATRVSWLGLLRNPDLLARAWVHEWRRGLDEPVLINASLVFKAPLTDIAVVASVHKGGVAYAPFFLFDDGEHGDNEPSDGTYGGYFNPDGKFFTTEGGYSVKVAFRSVAGISKTVTYESFDDDVGEAKPIKAADVVAYAETSFHLAQEHECSALVCPTPGRLDLPLTVVPQGGGTIFAVVAAVSGLPLLPDRFGFQLGAGVDVSNLRILPGGPAKGLGGSILFDVDVANDARVGTHTASLWVGVRKLTAEFEVVCGEVDLAPPLMDAPRQFFETCSMDPESYTIDPPTVVDECSSVPVALSGEVTQINGVPIVPPTPVDPVTPTVSLPPGDAILRWVAEDASGNAAERRQRVDVNLAPGCSFSSGAVPDGSHVPGSPVVVGKIVGGDIQLSWSQSCASTDTDYGVYEGTLGGDFQTHTPRLCSTSGATTGTLTPGGDSHYYLVVPRNAHREGSYGFDSAPSERPQGQPACVQQSVGSCIP